MFDIDEIAKEFVKESHFDFVGLWEISSVVRRELGAKSEDVRHLSLEIVQQLYTRGLRPGDYNQGVPEIDYWPDEGCQAMIERIEREWIAAGEDPNLAEPICWFGLRPK